ncbi:uncharacterized protein LOC141653788 isoform X2 [Silene latifolia]|uniref:uncharacterized protein LOC141653788 isoform X2 n=1 Tax=Silene latifolia TaxID=37657 RepID=UPI003D76D9ED
MSFIHGLQFLPSIQTCFIKTQYYHYKYHSTITSEQHSNNIEIRVCTNKTCRRQGSMVTLDTLLGIAPPHVSVSPSGCLGRCGAGPNLVVLPQAAMASHCGTPARAAQVMAHVCGDPDPDGNVRRNLDALALRKRAEVELEDGHLSIAEALFSQAIEAKPIGGIHIAYQGRAAVRLASGNFDGALEDANEALVIAPHYAQGMKGEKLVSVVTTDTARIIYNLP